VCDAAEFGDDDGDDGLEGNFVHDESPPFIGDANEVVCAGTLTYNRSNLLQAERLVQKVDIE
jgi:hypothetical protein